MSDCVAFLHGRAVPRLALTGLALLWLSGCSSDVTRFDTSSNPFTNPFSSQPASATPPAGSAPAGRVAAAPLAPAQSVASAPLPPPGSASASAAPVGGSAAGWTAAGGTPVVVAPGETLDSVSRRYGVPAAALLSANGLSAASEVKGGMRLVVPVYNAGAVASKAPGKAVAEASAKSMKKRAEEVAANEEASSKAKKLKAEEKAGEKTKEKAADKSKAEQRAADAAHEKRPAQPLVAKNEIPKSGPSAKKPAVDDTPTGNVDPKAAGAKPSSQQADASGATPEFRWPARGRIIQGFKTGGNDGIDISVPAGTSVRAAESGVVVYSGDGLKGYGNLVLIKHPNGFVTAYANNGELDVKRGETVKRGQIIAKSGDTGNVNSPQLHFELRKGSTPVDPTQYLAGL